MLLIYTMLKFDDNFKSLLLYFLINCKIKKNEIKIEFKFILKFFFQEIFELKYVFHGKLALTFGHHASFIRSTTYILY